MNPIFKTTLHSGLSFGLLIFAACKTVEEKGADTNGNNPKVTALPETPHPSLGTIERLNPALDKLIARDAKIEQLADGFDWSEGPAWVRTKQGHEFLLFSDIPPNKIYKWSEQGGLEEFLHPSGYTGLVPRIGEPGSNGLLLDELGRLVLCQHGDRRIARLGVGRTFQITQTFTSMTVRENLQTALLARRKRGFDLFSRAAAATVGCARHAERHQADRRSRAQRQLAAVPREHR